MQVNVLNPKSVHVALSRKNLLDLLAALDDETIHNPQLMRQTEQGVYLTVRAETDEQHYQNREAGPGYSGRK